MISIEEVAPENEFHTTNIASYIKGIRKGTAINFIFQ